MKTISLSQRFAVLDKALLQYQPFWRIEPFHLSSESTLPWESLAGHIVPEHILSADNDAHSQGRHELKNKALCTYLQSLDEHRIEHFKSHNDELVAALSDYIPQLDLLWQYCQLPHLDFEVLPDAKQLNVGIPGRKWQQISAMGYAALQAGSQHKTWLEWCAGKGYLGQWLAQQSFLPVVSFEWQQQLCQSGQALADKHDLDMTFVQGDALSDDCQRVFASQQHAVALHACGDLHAHLIKHVCQHHLSGASFAPCCYHLIQTDDYQPMSEQAQQSKLHLSKTDLRIPLQETVTGGERVKRHRQLEMSFRLGLDSLLKHQLGNQDYIPIPSIKKSLLTQGFEYFCRWALQQKGMDLAVLDLKPVTGCEASSSFDYWYQKGCERFLNMERLSLVQQVFRRPLEMWLVCDKALYLQQAGYDVSLLTFCQRNITPRNILIQAITPEPA